MTSVETVEDGCCRLVVIDHGTCPTHLPPPSILIMTRSARPNYSRTKIISISLQDVSCLSAGYYFKNSVLRFFFYFTEP